jgi:hypothetical protein
MTEKRRNKHLGSSFDTYLVEEGLYDDATSVAWERVAKLAGLLFKKGRKPVPIERLSR